MSNVDSADHYRFGYSDKEFDRLGAQHRIWSDATRRLLRRAKFDRGDTVVDLGCGPGFTTLELARAVGSQGRVIAVDRDGERSIPYLKSQVEKKGITNVEAQTSELSAFDLPDGSVDGVFGRWVLMYLPEREAEALVSRIAKWIRPGGVCVLAELCNFRHMVVHPQIEQLPVIAEALINAVTAGRDCNPEIGNELPRLLTQAGLEIDINVVTRTARAMTPEWRWPDDLFRDHAPKLVEDGYLERDILDLFMATWQMRSSDPHALFFGTPVMEVIGRRP